MTGATIRETRERVVSAKRLRQTLSPGKTFGKTTAPIEAYARIKYCPVFAAAAAARSAAVVRCRPRSLLTVFGARGPVVPVGYGGGGGGGNTTTAPPSVPQTERAHHHYVQSAF